LYVAGDTVYFKAYVTKGERHELTDISVVLHVDLISNVNNIIMQSIRLQLNNGTSWGDFSLPDTLHKGSYRIRAYTEWMRNGQNPDFFEQYISVSSLNNAERVVEAVKTNNQSSLQFFPEGGNLVTGVRSKVAFKAIGTDGLGINIKGVIFDDNNKEIAKIESIHAGMGAFTFIPEEGMKYKAEIKFADGSKSVVNLPQPEMKGITLSVNTDNPSKIAIEIKANKAYFQENFNKPLNLLVYSAGAIRTITTKMDSPILGLDLPAKNFRTGVLQVTLLSQVGEPMNERMVFIQNPDLLNLSLTTNKQVFARRGRIDFTLNVVDESKISVDENSGNSILSYLLLTSDLKGFIEKPNYYFSNITKESRASLDALMLTQGYRRFVWRELLKNNLNAPLNYKPERSLELSGQLTTNNGIPIKNVGITLFPLGITDTTNTSGRFHFERIGFQTSNYLILKTNFLPGKKGEVITLDKPVQYPVVSDEIVQERKYNASADILALIQNDQSQGTITASYDQKQNNNLTRIKRADNYRSSNLGGPGHADQVISGDDVMDSPTLSIGLNGRARGVDFVNGIPFLRSSAVVLPSGSAFESMMLVVDGDNLGVNLSVDVINPPSVETVEILKGPNAAIYGVTGGAGVMVITTRQGGSSAVVASSEMSPGVFAIHPNGYYKAREFYSPSYEINRALSNVPDNRTTVFWKPDVTTAADGNASFKYFNADGTGTYRVVVEGIDVNGNIGRQVFRYKVE
jgi:hypothetical protein